MRWCLGYSKRLLAGWTLIPCLGVILDIGCYHTTLIPNRSGRRGSPCRGFVNKVHWVVYVYQSMNGMSYKFHIIFEYTTIKKKKKKINRHRKMWNCIYYTEWRDTPLTVVVQKANCKKLVVSNCFYGELTLMVSRGEATPLVSKVFVS